MKQIIIGTKNRKKLLEIKDLLRDLPVGVVDLSSWPSILDVEETGKTFEENALLKASAYAKETGGYVLAEDSGLVVPALGGEPGIYSARYAGEQGNDGANNAKLLGRLEDIPAEKREAYYVCCAVLVEPSGKVLAVAEGRCHGRILKSPRGEKGFGYDPLFLIPEYHQTFGELSLPVKQSLSHRAKAISALRPWLWKLTET